MPFDATTSDLDTQVASIRNRMVADPAYVSRLFQIESGGNPGATTGSNRGLGQFGPQEEARYGLSDANRSDYGAQASAVSREYGEHYPVLAKALGRAPTPGEMYLAHQQGVAGGPALLTADPGTPAWQAIRPYYRSDAIAKQAITGNIPANHPLYGRGADVVTAGDFRNLWTAKFGNTNTPASSSAGAGGVMDASGPAAPALTSRSPELPGSSSNEAASELARVLGSRNEDRMPASPQPLQFPANAMRLRNAMMSKMNGASGVPLPPSVAQRLASLIGRTN